MIKKTINNKMSNKTKSSHWLNNFNPSRKKPMLKLTNSKPEELNRISNNLSQIIPKNSQDPSKKNFLNYHRSHNNKIN